ncbi:MAG: DUF4469 domain-containing protein [Chloroflexia bacterium]|nr:DUF4469 domain-containing protein [Chloroflexia bacterium]
MRIDYALLPNNLTGEAGDYMAKVYPTASADLEKVIEHMLRKASTVGEADIRAVLANYRQAILEMLCEGQVVTTDLATFSLSLRGHFDGPDDRYNPKRHRLLVRASATKRLIKAVRSKVRLRRVARNLHRPNPREYLDFASDSRNQTITPGGLGQLLGGRLQFDPADPAQGLFFVDAARQATRVATCACNKPRRLIFTVPALPPGAYRLEVRATIRDSADVRVGHLDKSLFVP